MVTEILTDDDLNSTMVEYEVEGKALSAFLCRPKPPGRYPGLILIQEWWGLNDQIKGVAQRLAKENLVVLAPDLYSRLGHVVTQNGAEAAKLADALDADQTLADLLGALRFLKGAPEVAPERVGLVGFSVGGAYALQLASRTSEVQCAVAFYGEIPPDSEIEKLAVPLLYFHGEEDGWIQKQDVQRLKETLKKFKKAGAVKTYPNAPHAFFNDARREVYHPQAAKDAWKKTLAFFDKYLRTG
ncbi:MAG: dienelactone hydrolase family protein [Nitrospirae bacterium]|nr:dienelactone hydrolase family protein [Candidatus Manganitrophaceae bacterium]